MPRSWWLIVLLACACASTGEPARRGDEIVACGRPFRTGTPVVTWLDPGGYAAGEARYGTRRVLPEEFDLADLRRVVTQVVVHYDVCGTSCNCFRVLERRGLSCHFLLDVDGTIYQTLDLKERAWHAGVANDRSIGIEIANIGAYRDMKVLDQWYTDGELVLPDRIPLGRLAGRRWQPARSGPIRGKIHGVELVQYDYTDAQYEALGKLLAALVRVFPGIEPRAPETTTVLPDPAAFRGIVGHYHLTKSKVDPGPAFDWERVLGYLR